MFWFNLIVGMFFVVSGIMLGLLLVMFELLCIMFSGDKIFVILLISIVVLGFIFDIIC